MPTRANRDYDGIAGRTDGFPGAYPVKYLDVRLMGEDYRMAYMDVAPVGAPNGRTVIRFLLSDPGEPADQSWRQGG